MDTPFPMQISRRNATRQLAISIFGLFALICVRSVSAEPPGRIIVDTSHTGIYKALARLTLDDFNRGDNFAAASHARELEMIWDRAETDLSTNAHDLFKEIDGAMDEFVTPMMDWSFLYPPDPKAVRSAYEDYIKELDKIK